MRETKKFQVGKHELELKTYLTERENRELIKILSGSFKIKDGAVESEDTNTETMLSYQDKLIENWVVSVDNIKEKILDTLLEWDKNDFIKVVNEINDISKADEKKTK